MTQTTVRIGTKIFSGQSKLHDGTLAEALRNAAINEAKRAVAAAVTATTLGALTDNSGGAAADGTVGAIPAPAPFTETGTASAQKAGLETALGKVKDGQTELAAALVSLKAIVPASDITQAIGGAAPDLTIAAYTLSVTAVNTSIAAAAGVKTVADNIRDYFATLVAETNKFAVAVGVAKLVNNTGGNVLSPPTLGALSVSTGTAVDGTALSGTSKADADAFLVACGAATKEIATKINAILAVVAPTVCYNVAAD